MDRMRKQLEKADIREPTDVHYGPEEDPKVARALFNKKRQAQNFMNAELRKQMEVNEEVKKRRLAKEKLTDSVNIGTTREQLFDEYTLKYNEKTNQKRAYKDAWQNQIDQGVNKRTIEGIVNGASF